MTPELDTFFIDAAEKGDGTTLAKLIERIEKLDQPDCPEIRDWAKLLLDNWGESVGSSPEKATFLIRFAAAFQTEFPAFSATLSTAAKAIFQAKINRVTAFNALGARDTSLPPAIFRKRFQRLQRLDVGRLCLRENSGNWCRIEDIDTFTGMVTVTTLENRRQQQIPLSAALNNLMIAETNARVAAILTPTAAKQIPPVADARETLTAACGEALDDKSLRSSMEILYVPALMTQAAFEKWWAGVTDDDSAKNDDVLPDLESVRGLHELGILLGRSKKTIEMNEKSLARLASLTRAVRPGAGPKALLEWVEIVSRLSETLTDDQLREFLPTDPMVLDLLLPPLTATATEPSLALSVWERLKKPLLPAWARCAKLVRGEKYLPDNLFAMPWRVWALVGAEIDIARVKESLVAQSRVTEPEPLFWIWKNRAEFGPELTRHLDFANVTRALKDRGKGAIWQEAVRELIKLLLNEVAFHRAIVQEDSEAYFHDCLEILSHNPVITAKERQSLVVKMAREFPKLKAALEAGGSKRVLGQKDEAAKADIDQDNPIVSIRSFHRQTAALKDIVSRQIPENTAAIAHARSYGDLRENAEYSAAKERQGFLNEQKAMIEKQLATATMTDFANPALKDSAIIGSSVKLRDQSGRVETYHLLGAWDSDPKRHFLSYLTEMGKALIGRKKQETIQLPDGRTWTIEDIFPLDESIRKELSEES